ncbi:L-seryl-tRNA(Sec) selenium transferase [Desulfallas thermosapovorans]|uniref:L-seryl-tRNA(Sec) selenium transferase n=1 Tax=Desulfallas thermosapovorans DSM 6562 TaxID=1121431 RepID=A0A5S4ZQT9_9FIRM|nr:L-seryl-tRNA(Sec) selenium transferase [Desulfallas thermosapovorans]TYO94970.1 L-seryl-tRNA(Sec) selenium transferase [Desulfallas thermosapovorans DSM 6562]
MSVNNHTRLLKHIPAVDEVLKKPDIAGLTRSIPRVLVLKAIRDTISQLREELVAGRLQVDKEQQARDFFMAIVIKRAIHEANLLNRSNLRRVLNVTGVVLHTNLGRAVLGENARQAINHAASGYSNLELDLATGKRGSRYAPVEQLLARLTGAEAALVVNNNAAAVLLALGTLARGKEVIVSRGQLVEIGGSFRIPEVMAQSGARLVEVGATNKTYASDYQKAITAETALLLHVHTSNYRIVGFTRETSIAELVELGRAYKLPVMSDLGSGSLVDLAEHGFPVEPTVQQVVKEGADVVTFSGDKLLGGPQAGIIVGKKEYLDCMKKNPLTRAVRIDKFTVSALEATLREYIDPNTVWERIPTLAMLTADINILQQKAHSLCAELTAAAGDLALFTPVQTSSAVGGGALPTADLPSWAVEVIPRDMTIFDLAGKLRETEPAVIGRLQDGKLLMDVRTLLPGDEKTLVEVVAGVLKGGARV